MRYARTRLDADSEDRAYRFFITEEIRLISVEISQAFGGGADGGINMNFHEYLAGSSTEKASGAEMRTEQQIIDYVKDGLHKLAKGSEK